MSSSYQTPESKKQEFRKYLEKSGVIDALTKGRYCMHCRNVGRPGLMPHSFLWLTYLHLPHYTALISHHLFHNNHFTSLTYTYSRCLLLPFYVLIYYYCCCSYLQHFFFAIFSTFLYTIWKITSILSFLF